MKIPVYNCGIEDSVNDITGIYAISFVDLPANEVDFVALSKNIPVFLGKNTQKQILTGAVLKPEQLIYRFSAQLGEHFIRFSAEQIERIAQKMMRTGVALYNTTHQHHSELEGNYLTELWIVENPEMDKSKVLGFKDLPKGTLMCSYKIEDKSYWDNEVMSGNVKGFSLEGFFNQELNMSKITNTKNVYMRKKKFNFSTLQRRALLLAGLSREDLSEIEKIGSSDSTNSGEAYVEFTLKDGKTAKVDKDGYATLDGEQMPAGEHPLANGNILVIDENGNFVETKDASAKRTNPDEATAAEALRRRLNGMGPGSKKQPAQNPDEENTAPADSGDQKSKIAEMQNTIEILKKALEEATRTADEVKKVAENLRKKTPSTWPAVQKETRKDLSKMTASERISLALSQTMKKRI